MYRFLTAVTVAGALSAIHASAWAQRDTTPQTRAERDTSTRQLVQTRDGSTLLGRIVAEDSTTIRLETVGGVLTLARSRVLAVKFVRESELRDGEYWFRDPNRSRLFFAPTGRMLDQGEGYYMNTYLVLQNFVGAPTNNVTIGGGFAPSGSHGFGLVYGVGTWGGTDGSVTGGLGWGYSGTSFASRPAVMLGGERRLSRRVAFITENYALATKSERDTCGSFGCTTSSRNEMLTLASYGLRFLGEKMSVDLAFWNAAGDGASWIFPGIPYVSFAVKF